MTKYLLLFILSSNLYSLTPKTIFKPLIIAHRVNTKKAIKKYAEAEAIEFDVHITKDNVLVLTHDPKVLFNNKMVCTKDLTFKELKSVVPDLLQIEELLELTKDKKLVVHIHNWFSSTPNYNERIIKQVLKKTEGYDVYSFISFDMKQLNLIKEYSPRSKIGYCVDENLYAIDLSKNLKIEELLQIIQENKVDNIVGNIEELDINYPVISPITDVFKIFKFPRLKAVALDNLEDIKLARQIYYIA